MKREAKLLLAKAINSLLHSVNHFNNSSDMGRTEGVLIFLDHSFEMLLKASLIERGATIRERGEKNTKGFDYCVRQGLTKGPVKFLNEEQALSLQVINSYRDAAQHYLLEVSEQLLYTTAQTGLTLFRTILKDVFNKELADYFPERVLPISTTPAVDIAELFHSEVESIRLLLQPGKRKHTEALARMRPLAIMEEALQGKNQTPSDEELSKLGKAVRRGGEWYNLFPSVASVQVTTKGYGPALEMSIVKKEGIPIQFVPEGTPNAGVLSIKRVNELDFYSLGMKDLCERININQYQCLAIIWYLKLQDDHECFKEIKIGKMPYKRYSQKALKSILQTRDEKPLDEICELYKASQKSGGRRQKWRVK